MSDHSATRRVTRSALKNADKRKLEKQRIEREKKRFNVGNQIGKNDIVVNKTLSKIKTENDSNEIKVDTETIALTVADFEETEMEVEHKVVVGEQFEDIPVTQNEPLSQVSVEPGILSDHLVIEEVDADNPLNGVQDVQNTQKSIAEDIIVEDRSTVDKVFKILYRRELINLKAMLHCRRVCREWKESVDWCLGEYSLSYGLERNYTFDDQKSLDKFLKASKHFGSSPVLRKIAKFELTHISPRAKRDIAVKNFWESVKMLLSKYGDNLKLVNIQQEGLGLTPLTWYYILEMVLPHVPNIDTLEICAEFEIENEDNETRTEQESDLISYIAQRPLPLFPKLQTLEFHCETSSILNAIVKNTPKLETLRTNALLEDTAVFLGKLPLKNLKLLKGPVYLKSLRLLNEDLEYLCLDFKNDHTGNKVPLQDLIRAIQRFKKLEYLSMQKSIDFDKNQHFDQESLKIYSVKQLYLIWCNNENRDFPQMIDDIFKPDGFYANIASYFSNITYLYLTEKSIDNMTCTNEDQSATLAYNSDIWGKCKLLEDVILIAKYARRSEPKPFIMTPAIGRAHSCFWTRKGYKDFHQIGKHSKPRN